MAGQERDDMSDQPTTTTNSPEHIRERAQAAYDRISAALTSLIDQGQPTPTQAHDTLRDLASIMAGLDQLTTPPVVASVTVVITPNKGNPPAKLVDAELHFTAGPLDGLKLIGFAVWERRTGNERNVTFPARQYSVNGERRSFALLRPTSDPYGQARIRNLILDAYERHETTDAAQSSCWTYDDAGQNLDAHPLSTDARAFLSITQAQQAAGTPWTPESVALQEASSSPNPDPGILIHAMQQSAARLYPSQKVTQPLIRARRF
jgi:hypothetical protein